MPGQSSPPAPLSSAGFARIFTRITSPDDRAASWAGGLVHHLASEVVRLSAEVQGLRTERDALRRRLEEAQGTLVAVAAVSEQLEALLSPGSHSLTGYGRDGVYHPGDELRFLERTDLPVREPPAGWPWLWLAPRGPERTEAGQNGTPA